MKGNLFVCLLAVSLLAGCAGIEFQDPHSASYSEVSIAVGDGSNGGVPGRYLIDVVDIKTTKQTVVQADHAAYQHLYLTPGHYELDGTCLRTWAEPGHSMPPYGLQHTHPIEHFAVTVEPHKKYVLDCTPGLDRSTFFLREAN